MNRNFKLKNDELIDSVMFKAYAFVNLTTGIADDILRKNLDLSFVQMNILAKLSLEPDFAQKDVADCMHITEAAISRQVEQLLQRGLINRHPDPKNRRRNNVSLTLEGEQIFKEARKILESESTKLFEILTVEEKEIFEKCLDKLLQPLIPNQNL